MWAALLESGRELSCRAADLVDDPGIAECRFMSGRVRGHH
jgi:hypothetical protein